MLSENICHNIEIIIIDTTYQLYDIIQKDNEMKKYIKISLWNIRIIELFDSFKCLKF